MSTPFYSWKERTLAQHAEEVARGEHDEACEFKPPLWVCHCAKRGREAAGFSEPPGPVEAQPPLCPRCYDTTDWDDGWWVCEECHVRWDVDDENHRGEFTDDYGDLAVSA